MLLLQVDCRRTKLFYLILVTGRRGLSTVKKPELSLLPRTYQASYVESRWYEWWQAKGFFKPKDDKKERFSIMLPPPNVTGSLHLGHTLTIAIQDALVRYSKMKGRSVLWIPGLDHAGIATQVQVEKQLWSSRRVRRHEMGREEFLTEAEKWKEEKSSSIKSQIRRLGAVVDWDRLSFTLDSRIQHGVREAFIRLHEKGRIYRDERLVNWCGALQSTISDIEVERQEITEASTKLKIPGEAHPVEFGYLSLFAYPLADGDGREEVVLATTRLETMLGDAAVAVHPEDPRYRKFHGRCVKHPFLRTALPIICDEFVDQKLGTGAVKITPAHDHNDFEVGKRHGLRMNRVTDDSGKIMSELPELNGLSRFQARAAIQSLLQKANLWRGRTAHKTVVPVCSRSGDVIEPQLKSQWFLECDELASAASRAVTEGTLRLVPDRFEKIWQQWLSERRDWCLSRQLWWGQRIPAYRAEINEREEWVSAHSQEEAAAKFRNKFGTRDVTLTQDPDVLDTWFTSSALPFVTLGWPDKTEDFQKHYPLNLMETGHDILFFWVARMVFMGLALTDKLPFDKVLLHGLICDKDGKKMSKSVGNVIDPMAIVCGLTESDRREKKKKKVDIGADALRFALCRYDTQQHFINVDLEDVEQANKFCNKIWQAFFLCSSVWEKFSGRVCDFEPLESSAGSPIKHSGHSATHPYKAVSCSPSADKSVLQLRREGTGHEPLLTGQSVIKAVPDRDDVETVRRWLLGTLHDLVVASEAAMEDFQLNIVAESLYDFWYDDFCDVYLESTKPVLQESSVKECQQIAQTMQHVFAVCLPLLSLFMPNLAEELYQRLPGTSVESVCLTAFPDTNAIPQCEAGLKTDMTEILDVSKAVKNIRAQYGIVTERPALFLVCPNEDSRHRLEKLSQVLQVNSKSKVVSFAGSTAEVDTLECAFDVSLDGVKIFVHLPTRFDAEREQARVEKQRKKLQKEIEELEEVLSKTRKEALIEQCSISLSKMRSRLEALSSYDQSMTSFAVRSSRL
ncbi:hypothetical protein RvY_06243 [Ramazzottius varieornatus]|uniref:Valine--tRNA ligase, mitochondrial n=1 Tax=Ramazzottius varieornatus TaxID=947166 RepID=A0A1D1V3D2_RAMVA|nr:hypothetical protein RvY_06243 [Ramazzottius varieornatus]